MNIIHRLFRSALLLALVPAGALAAAKPADGRVTVVFDHPEKYTDLRESQSDYENEFGRKQYLPLIQEHLEQQAGPLLADGQRLSITFTDIDLAGDFEPWRGPRSDEVRIVKDIYIPRLTFSFKLTDASGAVLKEGERRLSDMAFQMRISGFRDDALRYEKDMLSDWLRAELRPAKG